VGALLMGGFSAITGCGGSAQYQIPDVAPVVKQKPADQDLLEDLGGGKEESKPPSDSSSGGDSSDDSKSK
jgi:hypothetical protein